MCKCKLYDAALLLIGGLVGIAVALLVYFGLLPSVATGLGTIVIAEIALLTAMVVGLLTGCRCMCSDSECQTESVLFAACTGAIALFLAVLAQMVLDGNAIFFAIVAGLAVMFFAVFVGAVAVIIRYYVNPNEHRHRCRERCKEC